MEVTIPVVASFNDSQASVGILCIFWASRWWSKPTSKEKHSERSRKCSFQEEKENNII